MIGSKDKDKIKAFKAAFGVKPDDKDWKKMLAAMNKGLGELKKWVDLLAELGNENAEEADGVYTNMEETAVRARGQFKKDEAGTGKTIRDDILPALLKETNTRRKQSKSAPVKANVEGRDVSVFWTDIPGFEGMDPGKRRDALATVAQKTADGLKLYDKITNPQQNDPPLGKASGKDVTDLVWALKSKAQSKDGPYVKGAMSVPNGESLRKFLDTCTEEVYPRKSSHLLEQQGRGMDEKKGSTAGYGQTARGMDFYGGDEAIKSDPTKGDGLLPAGMNALLYQKVTGLDGKDYLYVKMETEGAYGSGGSNKKIDPTAPDGRPSRSGDTMHTVLHGLNLVKSMVGHKDEDKDLGSTREQTPKELTELCKKVIKAVTDKDTKKALTASFGTELKWLGTSSTRKVRLNSFLSTALTLLRSNEDSDVDTFGETARGLMQQVMDKVDQLYGEMEDEEFMRRSGDEVVLTAEDMQ